MNRIFHHVTNLLEDESGQDLIEYALIASAIALCAVAAMGTVTTAIKTAFSAIASDMTAPPS